MQRIARSWPRTSFADSVEVITRSALAIPMKDADAGVMDLIDDCTQGLFQTAGLGLGICFLSVTVEPRSDDLAHGTHACFGEPGLGGAFGMVHARPLVGVERPHVVEAGRREQRVSIDVRALRDRDLQREVIHPPGVAGTPAGVETAGSVQVLGLSVSYNHSYNHSHSRPGNRSYNWEDYPAVARFLPASRAGLTARRRSPAGLSRGTPP